MIPHDTCNILLRNTFIFWQPSPPKHSNLSNISTTNRMCIRQQNPRNVRIVHHPLAPLGNALVAGVFFTADLKELVDINPRKNLFLGWYLVFFQASQKKIVSFVKGGQQPNGYLLIKSVAAPHGWGIKIDEKKSRKTDEIWAEVISLLKSQATKTCKNTMQFGF